MYKVKMTKIPWLEVGKSDVIFHIDSDEEKLGALRVSQGHIVWTPADKQLSYWLNWHDFNELAEKKGQKKKAYF